MKKINLVFIVLVVFLINGCVRYSFKGALPSDLKTIFIPSFENKASSAPVPESDERLTRLVSDKFIEDNSLAIVNSEKAADLILTGIIRKFDRGAENILQGEVVSRFRLTVTVEIECFNTHTNKPLWKGTLSKSGYYEDANDLETAFDEAIELLAEEILNKTIAAW